MSMQLLSGHMVEQVSEEEVNNMEIVPYVRGIVRLLPEGWLYPWSATNFLDKIYNMKVLMCSSLLFIDWHMEA